MKLERAGVNAGKEVAAQPGNQNYQRSDAAGKERNQENTPVTETNFQQAVIALTKPFEGFFETLLQSYQGIAAGGISRFFLVAPQQVLGHCRDDSSRKEIGSQHCKNNGFRERHEQIPRDAGQQEHGSKHNADRKRGHECGRRDLRRAVQDNFVHVLLGFGLAVAIDILDLDRGVVH